MCEDGAQQQIYSTIYNMMYAVCTGRATPKTFHGGIDPWIAAFSPGPDSPEVVSL